MEILSAGPYWTPDLQSTFKELHNYSIDLYAINRQGKWPANPVGFSYGGSQYYVLDTPDGGARFVADFRSTLTYLYGLYLQHWNHWAHSYLNIQKSTQPGYDLPVDMLAGVPITDAPETENLGFNDNIDTYRQIVGPATLAGKRIFSMEVGAVPVDTYNLRLPQLATLIKRGFASGVNQYVIHGSPYSHQYHGTTWPEYISFNYFFPEQNERHQPAWINGRRVVIDYVARTQSIQQTGTPKIDGAFYDLQTAQNDNIPTLYPYDDLINAGYSYQYLSPLNFQLPQAVVLSQVLTENAPASKP